jgi:hypothetical protein
MGSTTGRAIKVWDLDNAHWPFVDQGFAEGQVRDFRVRDKSSHCRPVVENNRIGQPLGLNELLIREWRPIQIDGGVLIGEVKSYRVDVKALQKSGRQDVLAGMLLHQVKPAGPVYLSFDLVSLHRFGQEMNNGPVRFSLKHVQDGNIRQGAGLPEEAGIMGLAAARRVECSAIQHHRGLGLPVEAL